eukprot:12422656-Karenia_brevis.AAC.1
MEPHMPRMALLTQAAGTAAAQVSRDEHQLQVCQRIDNAWYEEVIQAEKKSLAGASLTSLRVYFAIVKQKVMRSNPPNP